MRKKTLIEMLIEAGYPKEQIHHHGIDLYIEVTPLTTKVLEDWCKQNGWDERLVKGALFQGVPFQDAPFRAPLLPSVLSDSIHSR